MKEIRFLINRFLISYVKNVCEETQVANYFSEFDVNPEVYLKNNMYFDKLESNIFGSLILLLSLFSTVYFVNNSFSKSFIIISTFLLTCSLSYLILFFNKNLIKKTDFLKEGLEILASPFLYFFYKFMVYLVFNLRNKESASRINSVYKIINSGVKNHNDYYPKDRMSLNETEDFKNLIKKELSLDPKSFFSKQFTYSQSLYRAWVEKVYIDNSVNDNFLFHSLMIPRKREIPVESLKLIFIALAQKEYVEFYYKNWEEVENISKKFKDMSLSKLTALFLRPFESQDFYIAISNNTIPNDSFNHFFQLNTKVTLNPSLENIKNEQFEIRLLKTKMDYWKESKNFKNCLNSHFFESVDDILVFYKDNKPFACVNVDNYENIGEISGVSNEFVHFEDQSKIRSIILNCLKEGKK